MNRLTLRLTLLITLATTIFSAFAQGSLTPPFGGPAPTMKTLSQIEPRIPLPTGPREVFINAPGTYYLTTNVTGYIQINARDVTLDLNGFSIIMTNDFYGITLVGGYHETGAVIKNGNIIGPGAITYSSNPWPSGINGSISAGIVSFGNISSTNVGRNTHIENVMIKGFSTGISIGPNSEVYGGRAYISRCSVIECGNGIFANFANISDCTISACSGSGVVGNFNNLENIVVDRCGGIGLGGTQINVRSSNIRTCGDDGVRVADSSVQNVSASSCFNGFNANNTAIEGATGLSNRRYGLTGSGNSIANSVFRVNTLAGIQGSLNTIKNVTANNNTGDGVNGGSLVIDGLVANANGGSGIVGNTNVVRSVRASANSGAGIWCDESTINECVVTLNAADGIRGVNSTINNCRAMNNDTLKTDAYSAADIYWVGGRQQGNVAGIYSPAAPAP